VDPAAALYYSLSPYHYGGNSPINTIDIDGRLFIYVNGFMVDQWWAGKQNQYTISPAGNTPMRNPNYSEYAPDRNFYTDGPRNAGQLFASDYWHGLQGYLAREFRDENMLFTNGSFYPTTGGRSRFNEGYRQAQNLIAMLDDRTITLGDGETIKIVGHSHGAAYAAGIATALMEHPVYKHLLEFVLYIAPDQPNQFRHPEGVPGYQFSTESDWVSSRRPLAWLRGSRYTLIEGAEWAIQREKHKGSRGGHGADSWVWPIVFWARSYGIPVTVVE
jgi:hypothetical protein